MIRAIALIAFASVQLGGSFGQASGSTVTLGDTSMVIDIEVEVLVSAQAVVAHLSLGDDTRVIPLLDRGGGVFGTRTELPRKDYVIVYEALGERGGLSPATTLSSLGVQLSAVTDATQVGEDDEGLSRGTRRWGWLALALAAASLSALAFWALADRGDRRSTKAGTEEE